MSENGMEKAANSATLQVLARYAMLVGVACLPLLAAAGGWSVNRLINSVDRLGENAIAFGLQLRSIEGQNLLISSHLDTLSSSTNARFDAQGRRIDKLSEDADRLKERVLTIRPNP